MLDVSVFPSISSDLAVGIGSNRNDVSIGQEITDATGGAAGKDEGGIEDDSFLISIGELRYMMFVCIRWRLENSKELATAVQCLNVTSAQEICSGIVGSPCLSSDSRIFSGVTGTPLGNSEVSTPTKAYLISSLFLYRSCVNDAQREGLELGVIRSILALIDPRVESRTVKQVGTICSAEKELEEMYRAESRLCTQFVLKGLPIHCLRTLFGLESGEVSFGDVVSWMEHSSGLNLANVASTPSVLGTLLKYFNVSWPNHVIESLLFQNSGSQHCFGVDEEQQNLETLTLSLGSLTHVLGLCKPCVFVNKSNKKCRNGVMCCFCHFQHKERKRGKRYKGGSGSAAVALQNTGAASLCGGSCGAVSGVLPAERDSFSTGTDRTGRGGLVRSEAKIPALGVGFAPFSASASVLCPSAFGPVATPGFEANLNVGTGLVRGGYSPRQEPLQPFRMGVGFPDVSFGGGDVIEKQDRQQQQQGYCQQEAIKYIIPPPPPFPSKAVAEFSFQDKKDARYEALNRVANPAAALAPADYRQAEGYESGRIGKITKDRGKGEGDAQQSLQKEDGILFETYSKMVSNNGGGIGGGIPTTANGCWMLSSIDGGRIAVGGDLGTAVAAVAAGGPLHLSSGEENGSSLYWPNCLEPGDNPSKSDSMMVGLSILSPRWVGKGVAAGAESGSGMKLGLGFDSASLTQSGYDEQRRQYDSSALCGFSFGLAQKAADSMNGAKEEDVKSCVHMTEHEAKKSFIQSSSTGRGALNGTFSRGQRGADGDSFLDSWGMIVDGVSYTDLGFRMSGGDPGVDKRENGADGAEDSTLSRTEEGGLDVDNDCGCFLSSFEFLKD
ncbi:hypothetical protein FG386_000384 [Cryptosporidium ryanae]|uniref:uncharacterized protein n=1 Tax=Cryptosporidium ryanae TaxID=515981 RepID=UPI00351A6E11|nr:hypothetical protein FG386_000384 [Cryptosporidium ryanae]